MIHIKIKGFAKKTLRFCQRYLKVWISLIWPRNYNLVFLFSNKSKYWTGIGKDLYNHEQIFKDTVKRCDQVIRQISNYAILSNFEGDHDDRFFENEGNIAFTVTTIQIALVELYRSKNIEPDFVSGFSLGEFAAVYAVGGLSMEDSLKLTHCAVTLLDAEKRDYVGLFAFADFESVNALCKKSKLWVAPIIHVDVNTVLLYCHLNDLAEVTEFFNDHQIQCKKPSGEPYWPFHTALIDKHKNIVQKFIEDVEAKPLQCDYYSATYGRIIPQQSIIPANYWFDMLRKPVLFQEVINMLKPLKNLVVLTLGPNFFLKSVLQNLLHHELVYLDSMIYNQSALQTFKSAFKSMKHLHLNKRKVNTPADHKQIIKKLNLNKPDLANTLLAGNGEF